MRPIIALALVMSIGARTLAAAAVDSSPAVVVVERLRAELMRRPVNPASAKRFSGLLKSDGSWADINYADRSRSIWHPVDHIDRLTSLALAYRSSHSTLHGDPNLKAQIAKSLDFWLKRDPQSDNWWQNTIGLQQHLAPLLILMREDLPPDAFRGACGQLRRSHVDKMTGTNLVWEAGNLFELGALTNDVALMRSMLDLITREIAVTVQEGVQPDWSFHQHGAQLNAGNYGISFIESGAHYAGLVQGTSLQFSAEKLAVLTGFSSNFQDWVVWGRFMDLSSTGRQLDLPGTQTKKAQFLSSSCEQLEPLAPDRAPDYRSLADRVAGKIPAGEGAPAGDRYFWRSDFLVHRPGNWYLSVKMFSPRVLRTETKVNSENYRGYHLCDGVTMLMVRGDEYEDIQPVWNWRMLPGITFKETSAPLPYGAHPETEHNPCAFVGGASDGRLGVAALEIQKEDVHAKKSWFCFPEGIVCLGSDIRSGGSGGAYTDLNQCLLRGSVRVLAGDNVWSEAPAGRSAWNEPRALLHDGVGYAFLQPAHAVLSAGPQKGSWADLRKEGVSPAVVTRDVFNLWIDHGASPRSGSYAYALLPASGAEAVARFAATPAFRLVSNTPSLQAVSSSDGAVTAAVFYAPGEVSLGGGFRLGARSPCIVITRKTDGGLLISASDPTQTLHSLTLDLIPDAEGAGKKIGSELALPQGGMAGSTVRATLAFVSKR